jgi:hypothetical protein
MLAQTDVIRVNMLPLLGIGVFLALCAMLLWWRLPRLMKQYSELSDLYKENLALS